MTEEQELHDLVTVLDYGYVQLIETWGSDERIIEAARMSTQKGFEGWGPFCAACGSAEWEQEPEWTERTRVSVFKPELGFVAGMRCAKCKCIEAKSGDEKLLSYLWHHKHMTPFEMAGATFEIKAPIFVFREWHRHRTQSYNEMSARYAPLPDQNYVPSIERLMLNSKTNKQAGAVKGAAELTLTHAEATVVVLIQAYEDAESTYQAMLRNGVPKELARLVLPMGRYSKMRASTNLRNWFQFLELRNHHAAQWEIQQFAKAVQRELAKHFPRTAALFEEGR